MSQKPRPSDEPIMTKWMAYRYLITGLYVGFATVGSFVCHYLAQGVSLQQLRSWGKCGQSWSPADGVTCESLFQGAGRELPQTLSLTVLVCMELFKALSAVSVDSSLLTVGPNQNPWLLGGVAIPFLLHIAVVYSAKLGFPGLAKSFGLVSSCDISACGIFVYPSHFIYDKYPWLYNRPLSHFMTGRLH